MESSMQEPTRTVRLAVLTPLAVVLAAVFFLPLLWVVVSAVRPGQEIFRYLSPITLRTLIPQTVTGTNFVAVLQGPLGLALVNSLIVSAVTVVVGLAICTCAAFALGALRFPFQNLLFVVVVVSFMVPFDAVAIPLASIFRDWGLQNTYAGLILPGLANGFAIFLLRQFFLGIPIELKEAAHMDGAAWWTIFWRVYLPLSTPVLIGAGLILFINQWQSYLWPLLVATDQNMQLAPIALANLLGQFNVDFGQLFAGTVIVTAIPALLMLPLQRRFVQSVATSGSKL